MRTQSSILALGIAGMVEPFLFTGLVIVQGILQPDYSHVAMPISALAAWPAGWMQNLNFLVAGTLSAAFAGGLHGAIRPTRSGMAGIWLLLAGSVGIFLDGLFPWTRLNGIPTEPPEHAVAAILTFSCSSLGLVVLSRGMGADPRWRDLSTYALGTGIVMMFLFVVVGFFAVDAGTPFHAWAGLLQRVLVGAWFVCLFVLARRVVRVAREGSIAGPRGPQAGATAWRS